MKKAESPPRGSLFCAIVLQVPFIAVQSWSWPVNLAAAAFFAGMWLTVELVHAADNK